MAAKHKDDGGPAFPSCYDDWTHGFGGMTLRDWFAGQAMTSPVVAEIVAQIQAESARAWPAVFAEVCGMAADAMLAKRSKL